MCGVAAGATRAALSQHFVRTANLSGTFHKEFYDVVFEKWFITCWLFCCFGRSPPDISAKEGIQETAVTLCGLVLGMACTKWINGDQTATWAVFIFLTSFHVYANYQAMKGLNLRSLNRQRAQIVCDGYIRSVCTDGT